MAPTQLFVMYDELTDKASSAYSGTGFADDDGHPPLDLACSSRRRLLGYVSESLGQPDSAREEAEGKLFKSFQRRQKYAAKDMLRIIGALSLQRACRPTNSSAFSSGIHR